MVVEVKARSRRHSRATSRTRNTEIGRQGQGPETKPAGDLTGHSGTDSVFRWSSRHPPYPLDRGVLVESRYWGWVHTHKV